MQDAADEPARDEPAAAGAELPPVGEAGAHRRPAAALRLANVMAVIGHAVLAAIALVVLVILRTELAAWIVLAGVLPALALWMVLDLAVLNRWEQRFYSYTVTDDFVYVTSGRFFRTTRTVPTPHILAVETQQGPLQRALDLMTVQLTTIAGQDELGPIAPADAERVRDRVTRVLLERSDG
ncbi:PH domain-containing protein [Agrococcus terreus]|uniref:PH domain-containing protein n=1 Tax=Agrococcus terreus TaxID=574649 RepID=UPI00384AB960